MSNSRNGVRSSKTGNGTRKSKKPVAEPHEPRPKRVKARPIPKGTAAEHQQAQSQTVDDNAGDMIEDAALLVGLRTFQHSTSTAQAPARIILTPMDRAFAASTGMSQEDMIEQKQWEIDNRDSLENDSDIDDEEEPVGKKKGRSVGSQSPGNFSDLDNDSEPGNI